MSVRVVGSKVVVNTANTVVRVKVYQGLQGRSLNNRGNWVTATPYAVLDFFRDPATNKLYSVLVAHTSTSVAADLAALKLNEMLNITQIETLRDTAVTKAGEALASANASEGSRQASDTSAVASEVSRLASGVSASASEASKVISVAKADIATAQAVIATAQALIATNKAADAAASAASIDPATLIPIQIHAATSKTTPDDADEFAAADSAAAFGLKKFTWANIETTLALQFAALAGLASQVFSVAAATAAAHAVRADQIQGQSLTAFTTGGTVTAFTLTPVPAISANTNGIRLYATFNAAAGAAPTMAVSGLPELNLKYLNSYGEKIAVTATQIPSGWRTAIVCDGTDWVIEKPAALGKKIIAFTRDMTSASGSVSYTGVNFKSKKITFQFGIDGTVYHGVGVAVPPGGSYSVVYAGGLSATDLNPSSAYSILLYTTDTSTYQLGVVTITAAGFDVAYTKGGTPTGTLRVNAICEE